MAAEDPTSDDAVALVTNAIIEANKLRSQNSSNSKVVTVITDAIVLANQILHQNTSVRFDNTTVQQTDVCFNYTKTCDSRAKPMSQIGWVSISNIPCYEN
jgi:hypothetical protein